MIESVVAGKPDFVALLGPTVKSRAGGEPRVASDPRQAFAFCAQTGGLLVVQYAGQEWLPVVRDLRSLCGDGISLVVAVAPDRMAEVSSLQHAGADEVVAWEGNADPVAWAIERALAARGAGASRATPAPIPPVVTYVAPAASPPPVLQRGAVAPAVVPATPPAATPAAAPGHTASVYSPPVGPAAWPANIPGADDAARLLEGAVAGAAVEAGPLAEAAARAAHKLSEPERLAMAGAGLPVDAEVVRRAAVLRFRVALALQAAPQAGEPGDAAAVQALLAEIDGVLAELKALEEGAPPEVKPGLDALRSGLVSEAIDLTEAVQRMAPPPAAAAEAAPPRPAKSPTTRVLSNVKGEEAARRPRLRAGWVVLLVLAALAAGGFHLNNFLTKAAPPAPPRFGGAPQASIGVRDRNVSLVVPQAGMTLDPKQVESFKAQEELKGNVVKEIAPGVYVSLPAAAEKKP